MTTLIIIGIVLAGIIVIWLPILSILNDGRIKRKAIGGPLDGRVIKTSKNCEWIRCEDTTYKPDKIEIKGKETNVLIAKE